MRGLAENLNEAHRAAETGFLAEATLRLSQLRTFLVASVFLLLTLAGAMGWVIYRDMIAPLRTRLVRSQTLLEHQEKLATLGTLVPVLIATARASNWARSITPCSSAALTSVM